MRFHGGTLRTLDQRTMTKPRLPVVGSTAASTAFVYERLDLKHPTADSWLWIDGNGKITAGNGTLASPRPNAFSLVEIEDCPQHTPTCSRVCYVGNLKQAQPDLYELYKHNSSEIRRILADEYLANAWVMQLSSWITTEAPHGFRFHVSGDVWSQEYAQWIADVCREAPNVRIWIYTRSFKHLAPLAEVSTLRGGNLALNLSCDQDNYEDAQRASREYGHGQEPLRLCYLTVDGTLPDDMGPDDVTFPDYALRPRQFATLVESPWWQGLTPQQRGTVCPVDAFSKSENRRCGPCQNCLT